MIPNNRSLAVGVANRWARPVLLSAVFKKRAVTFGRFSLPGSAFKGKIAFLKAYFSHHRGPIREFFRTCTREIH